MPYADPAAQLAYQREWIKRRRDAWIAEHGPCAGCGSSDDLEVDHIDPSTKLLNPRGIWSLTAAKRAAELAKCQVLCGDCHKAKTREQHPRGPHGTHNRYSHGCRCDPCRAGHAAYRREQRQLCAS